MLKYKKQRNMICKYCSLEMEAISHLDAIDDFDSDRVWQCPECYYEMQSNLEGEERMSIAELDLDRSYWNEYN